MSSQPSTIESMKNCATSAYATIPSTQNQKNYDSNVDPTNFSKDVHGNPFKKGDYKNQLNQAADAEKKEPPAEGVVDKVLAYIPGVGRSENESDEKKAPVNPGLPPNRQDHDVQVEEFLRDQYRSRAGDNMPDPDTK